jgi:predicted NAD-dependent protein-ADP-ribosyltransferase YbiA (DUF1768 family)
MNFKTQDDGVTHINIFSRGKTELGRLLSNFAHTPIRLKHGTFQSIEGYWYWLSVSEDCQERDDLKSAYGWKAKQLGKRLKEDYKVLVSPKEAIFRRMIEVALYNKLQQHPKIKRLLITSDLPFTHYYVFGGLEKDAGFEWITDFWTRARSYYQGGN